MFIAFLSHRVIKGGVKIIIEGNIEWIDSEICSERLHCWRLKSFPD